MSNNLTKVISLPSASLIQKQARAQTVHANSVGVMSTNANVIMQELESSLENRSSDLDDYQGPKVQTLEPMMIHGTGQKLKPKEISKKLSPKSTNVNKKIIYTYESKTGGDDASKVKKGLHQHGFSSHSGTTQSNVNESSKFVTLDPPTSPLTTV